MNLGYTSSDITVAATYDWTPYFERLPIQKLTRKGTVASSLFNFHSSICLEFRLHKDFLVSSVRKRAIKRLRCARKDEISAKCETYRATLLPREWLHFPPTRDIMKAPIFAQYIKQDLDRPTKFSEAQALKLLPGIVKEWRETKREELALRWMQETGRSSMPIEEAKDYLLLAKSVFLCSQCKELDRRCNVGDVLCGWDAALSHLCYMPFDRYYDGGYLDDLDDLEGMSTVGHRELEFSTKAEAVVGRLLENIGLNSNTTTAEQLDELDYRFFCEKCPISAHRKGLRGKNAYTWKECVSLLRLSSVFRFSYSSLTRLCMLFKTIATKGWRSGPRSPAWVRKRRALFVSTNG